MGVSLDLDAEAASLESRKSNICTVCSFIARQPDPEPWDALIAGHRQSAAVFKVMRSHGYEGMTDGPVSNHRNNAHRT